MSDIVERLLKPIPWCEEYNIERREAADEIKRLEHFEAAEKAATKENERLRAALTAMREAPYEQPIGCWFGAINAALE